MRDEGELRIERLLLILPAGMEGGPMAWVVC